MRYEYDTLLIDTDLDPKTRDLLIKNGIIYYGQLRLYDKSEYKKIKGFGPQKWDKLIAFIGDDRFIDDVYFFGFHKYVYGRHGALDTIKKLEGDIDRLLRRIVHEKEEILKLENRVDLIKDLSQLEALAECKTIFGETKKVPYSERSNDDG